MQDSRLTLLCIRVDHIHDSSNEMEPDDTYTRLCQWLQAHSTKYMIYEEVSLKGKLHYQGTVELLVRLHKDARTGKLLPTWAGSLKQYIQTTGNNQYSLTLMKSKTYEIYVSKDKLLKTYQGYSLEVLQELQNLSYKPEVDVTKGSTFVALYLQYMEENCNIEIQPNVEEALRGIPARKVYLQDNMDIADYTLRFFIEKSKLMDTFILARFANLFAAKIAYQENNLQRVETIKADVTLKMFNYAFPR